MFECFSTGNASTLEACQQPGRMRPSKYLLLGRQYSGSLQTVDEAALIGGVFKGLESMLSINVYSECTAMSDNIENKQSKKSSSFLHPHLLPQNYYICQLGKRLWMSDNDSIYFEETNDMDCEIKEITSEKITAIHHNKIWLSTVKWINSLNTEIQSASNIPFVWEDFQKNIIRCAIYFYAKSHLSEDLPLIEPLLADMLDVHGSKEHVGVLTKMFQSSMAVFQIPRRHGKSFTVSAIIATAILHVSGINIVYIAHQKQATKQIYDLVLQFVFTLKCNAHITVNYTNNEFITVKQSDGTINYVAFLSGKEDVSNRSNACYIVFSHLNLSWRFCLNFASLLAMLIALQTVF